MERWTGRVAVVTGASEGIGEAIVRSLAKHGMKVAALARRADMLQVIEKDLEGTVGVAKGYICDVTKEDQVQTTFARIAKDLGPISVLINNAGVFGYFPLTEIDNARSRTILETNVLGILHCTRETMESFKCSGVQDGHIFNLNSVAGHKHVFNYNSGVYTASKHAVTCLTQSLLEELVRMKSKIRVTSISPGAVVTSMTGLYLSNHPDHLSLSTEDIVDAVIYALAAPPNVNITELTLQATGEII